MLQSSKDVRQIIFERRIKLCNPEFRDNVYSNGNDNCNDNCKDSVVLTTPTPTMTNRKVLLIQTTQKEEAKYYVWYTLPYIPHDNHRNLRSLAQTWGRRCDGFIAASKLHRSFHWCYRPPAQGQRGIW